MALRLSQEEVQDRPGVEVVAGRGGGRGVGGGGEGGGGGGGGARSPHGSHPSPSTANRPGSSPLTSPSSISEADIQTLIFMGFTRDQVVRALRENSNDVQEAANALIGYG